MSFPERFVTPTKKTVLIYVVISFSLFIALAITSIAFIPCMKQQIIDSGIQFSPGMCTLSEPPTIMEYTVFSYIVIFIVVVLIPYSVAVMATSRGYRPPRNDLPPPEIPALPESVPKRPEPPKRKHHPKKVKKKSHHKKIKRKKR